MNDAFRTTRNLSKLQNHNLQREDDDGAVYGAAVIISNLHLLHMTNESIAGAASDRLTCRGLIPMFHVAYATL